jgi:hypothetical protein
MESLFKYIPNTAWVLLVIGLIAIFWVNPELIPKLNEGLATDAPSSSQEEETILSFSGVLKDDVTGLPLENVKVFFEENPTEVVKVNQNGEFFFSKLRTSKLMGMRRLVLICVDGRHYDDVVPIIDLNRELELLSEETLQIKKIIEVKSPCKKKQ